MKKSLATIIFALPSMVMAGGLTALGNQQLYQGDTKVKGMYEANDQFGKSLASGDFDNDGYTDLIIGVPKEDIKGNSIINGGAVHVMYGSKDGIGKRDWLISQDMRGIYGLEKNYEDFGSSVAVGDINGDSYDDVVIGIPSDSNRVNKSGSIQVFFGGLRGLSKKNQQIVHQDSRGIRGARQTNDYFGYSVAVGDFDNDSYADVAVGIPFEDLKRNTIKNTGAIQIIFGSSAGLSKRDKLIGQTKFNSNNQKVSGDIRNPNAHFGMTLTTGDFNKDGIMDLAVGAPNNIVDGKQGAGTVSIFYGSTSDFLNSGENISQNSTNMQGLSERNDYFGSSLTAGDYNADGADDLAIGVRGEDITINKKRYYDAGAVQIVNGSIYGISTKNRLLSRYQKEVSGSIKSYETFGNALSSSDFNGDGVDDLAVGVYRQKVGSSSNAGAVQLFYGAPLIGIRYSNETWTQDSINIQSEPGRNERFGSALVGGDFNGDNVSDLAIGVVYDKVKSTFNAGAVNIIYGSKKKTPLTNKQIRNIREYIQTKTTSELERKAGTDQYKSGFQFGLNQSGYSKLKFSDGYAWYDSGMKMRNDMLVNLGSVSKMVMTISILKLADAGLLDLNKPFVEYLPMNRLVGLDFYNSSAENGISESVKKITIMELLTHSSSLRYSQNPYTSLTAERSITQTYKDNVYNVCTSDFKCNRFYQNANQVILRWIIEKIGNVDPLKIIDGPKTGYSLAFVNHIRGMWLNSINAGGMGCGPLDYPADVNYRMQYHQAEAFLGNSKSCSAGGWRGNTDHILTLLKAIREGQVLSREMTALLMNMNTKTTRNTRTALGWDSANNSIATKSGGLGNLLSTCMGHFPADVDMTLLINQGGIGACNILKSAWAARNN